jgi:hypothetical protein
VKEAPQPRTRTEGTRASTEVLNRLLRRAAVNQNEHRLAASSEYKGLGVGKRYRAVRIKQRREIVNSAPSPHLDLERVQAEPTSAIGARAVHIVTLDTSVLDFEFRGSGRVLR